MPRGFRPDTEKGVSIGIWKSYCSLTCTSMRLRVHVRFLLRYDQSYEALCTRHDWGLRQGSHQRLPLGRDCQPRPRLTRMQNSCRRILGSSDPENHIKLCLQIQISVAPECNSTSARHPRREVDDVVVSPKLANQTYSHRTNNERS